MKSDIKSITILNSEYEAPPVNYEQPDKSAAFVASTTTSKPDISITTAQPIKHHDSYEFEEQIVYEYHPQYSNKTVMDDRHESNNEHIKVEENSHVDENENFHSSTSIPYTIELNEKFKPHLNFTRIAPVLNVIHVNKHQPQVINDAETDYYEREVERENDYDGKYFLRFFSESLINFFFIKTL